MKQSPNDFKNYKSITLSNGLRALLVHNKETQKSAAALAINVGHFNDPIDRQGIAHFLEHMLFLGTKKYPDGSEYQKFISQYGGNNNAWTGTEHTCFFFDINHQHFEKALDRFSRFFTEPLLSEEFINKERENIDAEFKLKLKDDIRRLYDVHKETINQEHPFSKFSVGNNETLADKKNSSIREDVSAFYNKYYQADLMTLVLEGPQSIENLTLLAEQSFSAIKQNSNPIKPIKTPLYLPEHKQVLIKVNPVKNDKQLIISFAMPSIDEYYRHKPESVLAYLLGHEGPGSILSLLKANQWAMGLTAGSGINGSNFKDFNISIQLTIEGENHLDDIIQTVFDYITLLQKEPISEHYYTEKKAIAELSFHYHEKQKPLDSVCQLVVNMHHYPEEDYIFGDYVMSGQCHELINNMLTYLTPTNMRLIHISQNNEFDKISTWYQVPYSIKSIDKDKILKWLSPSTNKALNLPGKNPYIVYNPKLVDLEYNSLQGEPLTPKLIDKKSGYSLWFKQDTTFKVPKGHIYIGIDSPISIKNNQNIAMSRLFVDLYSDALIEQHYDAELAGIHYHLYSHQGGMTLQLSGISEKQGYLLKYLLKSLHTYRFTNQHFELFKHQLITHWKNSDTSKSISQLFSVLSSTMQPTNPSSEALTEALNDISFANFTDFSKKIFNAVCVEVLIHGNWQHKDAISIGKEIKAVFNGKCNDKYQVKIPVLDIEKQGETILPLILPEHDYATVLYYPLPDKNLATVAKTMLTSQLLSPVFFQEMRTEKQYGYLVGVGFIPINKYPGIAFYIQSPHTKPEKLIDAIDDFVATILIQLRDMATEDWNHLQHGLASQLQEKDSNLRIKSHRFWSAICNKENNDNKEIDFNQKQKIINEVLSLTLADILSFIDEHLNKLNMPDRITLASYSSESPQHHNDVFDKIKKEKLKKVLKY